MSWSNRLERAKSSTGATASNGKIFDIYNVGQYEVHIERVAVADQEEADIEVFFKKKDFTVREKIEIVDGEVRIPMEGVIENILRRTSPAELANEFWVNEEVREAFLEKMIDRYAHIWSDRSFHEDRLKFLAKVQQEVWEVKTEDLTKALAKADLNINMKAQLKNAAYRVNEALRRAGWHIQQHLDGRKPVISPEELQGLLDCKIKITEGPELMEPPISPDQSLRFWRDEVRSLWPAPSGTPDPVIYVDIPLLAKDPEPTPFGLDSLIKMVQETVPKFMAGSLAGETYTYYLSVHEADDIRIAYQAIMYKKPIQAAEPEPTPAELDSLSKGVQEALSQVMDDSLAGQVPPVAYGLNPDPAPLPSVPLKASERWWFVKGDRVLVDSRFHSLLPILNKSGQKLDAAGLVGEVISSTPTSTLVMFEEALVNIPTDQIYAYKDPDEIPF